MDLMDRRIYSGWEMSLARYDFHLATIISGGEEKMFALAGLYNMHHNYNEVEEWVEASSTWKTANSLVQKRDGYGAVALPKHLICPI